MVRPADPAPNLVLPCSLNGVGYWLLLRVAFALAYSDGDLLSVATVARAQLFGHRVGAERLRKLEQVDCLLRGVCYGTEAQ